MDPVVPPVGEVLHVPEGVPLEVELRPRYGYVAAGPVLLGNGDGLVWVVGVVVAGVGRLTQLVRPGL